MSVLKVDLPKNQSSIIKVVGVGGGGSNAVNYMYNQGINGVDFIICNTDAQALDSSPIPTKIQLGKGLGAGNIPSVAQKAAEEKSEEIKAILEKNTQMLFITAGMGGGTGTGAAPVIAALAKEIDLQDDQENKILTVAIVTLPFTFEGRKRKLQAEEGIKELKKHVDAILVINNDKLREFGDLPLGKAFEKADNILTTAAKGIAEIITVKAFVNIDFKDVNTVMKKSGVALMGSGIAEGENRAYKAIEMAINSPLLDDNYIQGAQNILLYFASSKESEITMDEITEITDFIIDEAGEEVDIIWGAGHDDKLGDKLSITLVATGFNKNGENLKERIKSTEKTVTILKNTEIENNTVSNLPEENKQEEELKEIKIIQKTVEIEYSKNNDIVISENSHLNIENIQKNTTQISDFGINNEPYIIQKQTAKIEDSKEEISNNAEYDLDSGERNRLAEERQQKLRNLSMGIRPENLTELENKPAFMRRNVVLTEVKPSSETEISRYTINENGENKIEIKQNNTFLHDNVD